MRNGLALLLIGAVFATQAFAAAPAPAAAGATAGAEDEAAARRAAADRAWQELNAAMQGAAEGNEARHAELVEQLTRQAAATKAEFEGCTSALPAERRPKIVETVPFEYPVDARRLNEEGLVGVCVIIGAGGQIEKAGVIQTSTFADLDEAGLRAVLQYKLAPGTDASGRPVSDRKAIGVRFRLEDAPPAAPAAPVQPAGP